MHNTCAPLLLSHSSQNLYLYSGVLQIDYFNNQIIVDLVEQQHKGIIAILDDACMNVGKVTDEMFLEALNKKLGKHAHFSSRKVTWWYMQSEAYATSPHLLNMACYFGLKG